MPRPLKLILLLVLLGITGLNLVRACRPEDREVAPGAALDTLPSAPSPAPPPFAAGARDDCASPATDSARAVCVAVRAARGEGGIGARVAEVVRQGDLICVRTVPVDPRAVDGGATVRVDREGRIRALMLTDSARSCGDLPPAEGISATDRRE